MILNIQSTLGKQAQALSIILAQAIIPRPASDQLTRAHTFKIQHWSRLFPGISFRTYQFNTPHFFDSCTSLKRMIFNF